MMKYRMPLITAQKIAHSIFFLFLISSSRSAYPAELDSLKNCLAEYKSKSADITPIGKPLYEHSIKSGERLISNLSDPSYFLTPESRKKRIESEINGSNNLLRSQIDDRNWRRSNGRAADTGADIQINYQNCLVSTLSEVLASNSTSAAGGLERKAGNCVEVQAGWQSDFFIIKGLNNCGVTQRLWACIEDPGHADSCRTGRFPATSYTILGSNKGSSENILLRAGRDINMASKGKDLRYKWWACEDPHKPARTATDFECVDFFSK